MAQNKVLREKGIPINSKAAKFRNRKINWNEELSQDLRVDVHTWQRRMERSVATFSRSIEKELEVYLTDVPTIFEDVNLVPNLGAGIHSIWKNRLQSINSKSATLEGTLNEQVAVVYRDATTETDTSCMIATMISESYSRVYATPQGRGRYRIMRKKMKEELLDLDDENNNFLDRFATVIHEKVYEGLNTALAKFGEDLFEELELFNENLSELLPTEYAMTALDLKIRKDLGMLRPRLSVQVKELQKLLETNHQQVKAPPRKRRRISGAPAHRGPVSQIQAEPVRYVEEYRMVNGVQQLMTFPVYVQNPYLTTVAPRWA